MLAYLGIEFAREGRIQVDNNGSMVELQLPTISCGLVEKLVKTYREPKKCHRCIFDHEKGYLNSCVQYMKTHIANIPV